VDGGHGGDADVHAAPAHPRDSDPPVLGQAALGDVQLGHDLDAGGQGGLQAPGRGLLVVEQPVDAVAHAQAVLEGLDVDVGGVDGERLLDEEIDEADDRRLEGQVAQVIDVVLWLGVPIGAGPHPLHDLLQGGVGPVGPLDGLEDGRPGRDAELDGEREGLLEIVEQQGIRRIRRRHGDRRALDGDRAGHVLAQVLRRQLLECGRGRRQLLGGEIRQLLLGRYRLQDIVSTGGAHGDQRLAEPLPLLPGPGERLLKQLVGDDARLHENLAQAERRRREAVQGGGIMVAAAAGRQSSLYVDSVSLLFQGRGRGGRLLYVTTSSGPEYR